MNGSTRLVAVPSQYSTPGMRRKLYSERDLFGPGDKRGREEYDY